MRIPTYVMVWSAMLALFSVGVVPVWPQANIGRISGTVVDASGSAIPGCSLDATQAQTGLVAKTETDENGFFIFPSLVTGTYTVRAQVSGFKPVEHSGIVLDASANRTLGFRMELGDLSQQISVNEAMQQVQTSTGEVSRLITDRQISQIAFNGRNHLQLLQLMPGSVTTNFDPMT